MFEFPKKQTLNQDQQLAESRFRAYDTLHAENKPSVQVGLQMSVTKIRHAQHFPKTMHYCKKRRRPVGIGGIAPPFLTLQTLPPCKHICAVADNDFGSRPDPPPMTTPHLGAGQAKPSQNVPACLGFCNNPDLWEGIGLGNHCPTDQKKYSMTQFQRNCVLYHTGAAL